MALRVRPSSLDIFRRQRNLFLCTFTVQGDIKDGTQLIAEGSLMDGEKYILDSFHFHWGSKDGLGSEHAIEQKTFCAEMHLVHYNAKYGTKDAALKSGDPKGLAVIGILFGVRNVVMAWKSPLSI